MEINSVRYHGSNFKISTNILFFFVILQVTFIPMKSYAECSYVPKRNSKFLITMASGIKTTASLSDSALTLQTNDMITVTANSWFQLTTKIGNKYSSTTNWSEDVTKQNILKEKNNIEVTGTTINQDGKQFQSRININVLGMKTVKFKDCQVNVIETQGTVDMYSSISTIIRRYVEENTGITFMYLTEDNKGQLRYDYVIDIAPID